MGRSVSDSASVRSRVPTICESAIRSRSERSICETAFTEFANDPGPRPCRADGSLVLSAATCAGVQPGTHKCVARLSASASSAEARRVVRFGPFLLGDGLDSRVPHTGLALRLTVLGAASPFRSPRSQGRSTMNATPPSGWYPDHTGSGQRYWDGQQWTGHTAPMGAESSSAAHPVTTTLGVATDGYPRNSVPSPQGAQRRAGVRPAPVIGGRHRRGGPKTPPPASSEIPC